MSKQGKYYSPSGYEKYRNASKALNGNNEEQPYSIHQDEYFYREIQKENNRHREREGATTPLKPKPPVNLKPKEDKPKSVYDEIARRHRQGKQSSHSGELTPLKPISLPKQEVPESREYDDDFYGDAPMTEAQAEEFTNKVSQLSQEDEEEYPYYTEEDIVEICHYYKKKYSRKMWIILLCSLGFFCVLMGVFYLYIMGYINF